MATTVETVRDLNNRYGAKLEKRLVCLNGHGDFTADLALYWCPRDRESFACPDCDRELGLRFEPCESGRLAQRFSAVREP